MELLRGRDLKEILEESGYLPLADAIGWTIEAAEALREAHSIGIVHRDIKPANLFIADTHYGRHVKVVDFGISKQNEPGDVNLTGSMACMGAPRYMAPEQMRSSKMADARSDVWALGIVLYELTTGRKPFDGDDDVEIIMSITE